MDNDPLDKVFLTPEERLAKYLAKMPDDLRPIFEKNFQHVKPQPEAEQAQTPVSAVELAAYRYYLGDDDAALCRLFENMPTDERERYARRAREDMHMLHEATP